MSTRFTTNGIPLVESQSLKLIQYTTQLNDVITKYTSERLIEKGYVSLTPSLLSFVSVLECGVNYGSEIARTLDVSRQMVAKTVKELCRLGYLEQKDGLGKQKEICFTEAGEHLMAEARQLLAELDNILFKKVDARTPPEIIGELDMMIGALNTR